MGAGLGVVVPVLFRAAGIDAGRLGRARASQRSRRIGWLGFLAGPPAIGFAAGAVGLRERARARRRWRSLALALLARSAGPRHGLAFRGLVIEPRAVLSDLDGVLVDSGAQIEATWRGVRRTARARRRARSRAEPRPAHRRPDPPRRSAPRRRGGGSADSSRKRSRAPVGLRALPGARELVESVPADRFAIVTSGSRPLAVARLRAAGIPVPEVLVTAEQVENGKPDPAGYLRAAELLGVDPAHALVLEDAPAGVEAGLAAGMTVVAVLTAGESRP